MSKNGFKLLQNKDNLFFIACGLKAKLYTMQKEESLFFYRN